jgi:carnitine O-acetyltransferase
VLPLFASQAREHLLSLSPLNRRTTSIIEDSLFMLNLDIQSSPPHPSPSPSNSLSLVPPPSSSPVIPLHLDSHLLTCRSIPPHIPANRWFDKSLNLFIEPSSRLGVMGEHSPCDAMIPSFFVEWILQVPYDNLSDVEEDETDDACQVEMLRWQVDDKVKRDVEEAKRQVRQVTEKSDAKVLWFEEFGSDWIRSNGISISSPSSTIPQQLMNISLPD